MGAWRDSLAFLAARRWTVVALLAVAVVGALEVGDMPISSDETFEVEMVDQNIALARHGTPMRGDLRFYGTVANFTSEAAWRVLGTPAQGTEGQQQLARLRFKHKATLAWAWLAFVAVAALVELVHGVGTGWVGVVILALIPGYWAHGFFNPKDIPFSSMFTLATWLGTLALTRVPSTVGRRILAASLMGVVVGLTAGIRIGGLALLGFLPAAAVMRRLFSTEKETHRHGPLSLVACVTAALATLFSVQPAAWGGPFRWLLDCVQYLAHHGFNGSTLFEGTYVPPGKLPWTYLPTWFGISTPMVIEFALLAGVVVLVVQRRRWTGGQRTLWLLVGLQMLALPLLAVVLHSVIYDGVRQFLLVFPAVAVVAASGIITLFQRWHHALARVGMAVVLVGAAGQVVLEERELHPYEYLYFNAWVGGLPGANGRYETDYWGLSLREAMEWVERHAPPGTQVYVAGNDTIARMFIRADMKVLSIYKPEEVPQRPYFYVAVPRWDWRRIETGCTEVHRVVREGVVFSTVQFCPAPG